MDLINGVGGRGRGLTCDELTTHDSEKRSVATKCSMFIAQLTYFIFLKCDYFSTRLQFVVMAGTGS